MIIPVRTETPVHLTPYTNYALLAANVLVFVLLDYSGSETLAGFKDEFLVLDVGVPRLYQFFTYQFLHGDIMHLVGNMVFLWVFGNSVNDKMGNIPYLLFYIAGGVFAAWGFSLVEANRVSRLLGASGSIAAVTTAFLVLFPRSRVKVLYWFFFIGFFELPAMVLIALKIILWDNIVAPQIGNAGNVAHGAHLAGYLFGFGGTLLLLLFRAVARDHFDLLSLWNRAGRRRQWQSAMAQTGAPERAALGRVARVDAPRTEAPEEQAHQDQLSILREKISEQLGAGDVTGACTTYEALISEDAHQCLSEREQLQIGREFYRTGRFPQAAAAFDRFLSVYKRSSEVTEVRLLLGIVYARDLRQYEAADRHLSSSLAELTEGPRRAQCYRWLQNVRAALGRPAPES